MRVIARNGVRQSGVDRCWRYTQEVKSFELCGYRESSYGNIARCFDAVILEPSRQRGELMYSQVRSRTDL